MNLTTIIQDVRGWIRHWQGQDSEEVKPLPEILSSVEEARREWRNAQNYYNAVSDTDLVDHAVYLLQAAEKKYVYLLKQARQEGVSYSPYFQDNRKSAEKFQH